MSDTLPVVQQRFSLRIVRPESLYCMLMVRRLIPERLRPTGGRRGARLPIGDPLKEVLMESMISDGFEMEGASLRSEGGDSAKDSNGAFSIDEVAPNQKVFEDSEVFGRRNGTLLEE